MSEPSFCQFGRTFVVTEYLWICTVREDDSAVKCVSRYGGPADVEGDDARELIVYLHSRRRAETGEDDRVAIINPLSTPRPGSFACAAAGDGG
jgi:hypothetical protein